ncbi:hypothetical protein [Roseiterribacter gracilis]|uniref:Uncharacterized protein n=1 Tax=Roseiterribacter gracilis TaxID=2812848 RepID=A0A8S8XAM1_9PROT|nr:hypothetical protein TMPK1_11480 [Rhodospirillales bacterium TMPK1]
MAGVAPTSGNLLRNVVSLLRTLSAAPSNPDKAGPGAALRGQSLVQPDGAIEGPSPQQAVRTVAKPQTVDQPKLTAVQLEYSPPAGGFDPYARRGTYLDITV